MCSYRSFLAAEILALSDPANNGIYISKLILDLAFNGVEHIPVEICTDS